MPLLADFLILFNEIMLVDWLAYCDQSIDSKRDIPCGHKQTPGQHKTSDDATDDKVHRKQRNAAAQRTTARHDPHKHPVETKRQAAKNPEPKQIQLAIPHTGRLENTIQQPYDDHRNNCFTEKFFDDSSSCHGDTSIHISIITRKNDVT